TLYVDDKVKPKLTRLGEELRFLLITSGAAVQPLSAAPKGLIPNEHGMSIAVLASEFEKCARCWHRRPDVGQDQQHPELCIRCVGNISGNEEERLFI
ncbi:MAG: isoleucine--tRNA ligase, partial [Legionella sp.]